MTYRILFEVRGRARFLSHLETVDTLLSALRRGGYQIALSRGMRPRPVISLAMPRAVGVESEAELAMSSWSPSRSRRTCWLRSMRSCLTG